MRSRVRPAYLDDKIALERQRREAIKHHVKPCDCPDYITRERAAELLAAALAHNLGYGKPVPF